MGCDWSKHQITFKDRQRLLDNESSRDIDPAEALSNGKEVPVNSNSHYCTSPADCFYIERESFKTLLEKSQHGFVDISQEPVFMDEVEAEERRKKYVHDFGSGWPSFDPLVTCPLFVDSHNADYEVTLANLAMSFQSCLRDIFPLHDKIRLYISGLSTVTTEQKALVVSLQSL